MIANILLQVLSAAALPVLAVCVFVVVLKVLIKSKGGK